MISRPQQTVLFLCTGNYYRSRFAEIYFNWRASDLGLNWRADSRGLALDPMNPGFMSRYTVNYLAALGIPIDPYQRMPKDLTEEDLKNVHHVVAVKQTEHRPLMSRRFPQWLEKVEFWEVHDIDCSDPKFALPHLEREVAGLLQRLSGIEPGVRTAS